MVERTQHKSSNTTFHTWGVPHRVGMAFSSTTEVDAALFPILLDISAAYEIWSSTKNEEAALSGSNMVKLLSSIGESVGGVGS